MVNGKQDNGAHDGTNEACAFIGTIPTHRLPKVSRDECADDTQYGGDDEAARISSGGQQLRHHSRQKSDEDGSNEMQHALGLRDQPAGEVRARRRRPDSRRDAVPTYVFAYRVGFQPLD